MQQYGASMSYTAIVRMLNYICCEKWLQGCLVILLQISELMYPENKIIPALSAFRNKKFDHMLDKTFWRPLPKNIEFYEKYEKQIRFAIICWYWTETVKR